MKKPLCKLSLRTRSQTSSVLKVLLDVQPVPPKSTDVPKEPVHTPPKELVLPSLEPTVQYTRTNRVQVTWACAPRITTWASCSQDMAFPLLRSPSTRKYVCLKTEDYMWISFNVGSYVFSDHFTKFLYVFPVANHDAVLAALAIFTYCVLYGAFDVLMTDPGSDKVVHTSRPPRIRWCGRCQQADLAAPVQTISDWTYKRRVVVSAKHWMGHFSDELVRYVRVRPFTVRPSFGTVTNRRFDFAKGSLDSEHATQVR